jgi:4-diphosphocytidyl-2-C-methyl-D-erythritol kinase
VLHGVRVSAPAKVNLYLHVGGLLPSGYHAVRSVLHTLELSDELRIVESPRLALSCDEDLGVPPQENLVWRAATAMGAALGRELDFEIRLSKRIPHGAGLGGGSSDAAATIAGLAHVWGVDPLGRRCLEVARSLGADVPFFLYGGAALMGGRGDVLVRRLPPLAAPVLLVRPAQPVPTAAAYRAFDAAPVSVDDEDGIVAALGSSDLEAVAQALANNLAPAAIAVVPEVGEALAWARAQDGVFAAEVAGSGSAVFALVDSGARASVLARDASARGWWGISTGLRPQGVMVTEEESA